MGPTVSIYLSSARTMTIWEILLRWIDWYEVHADYPPLIALLHWYPLTTCRILSMLTCWKLFTVIQVWTCFMYKLLRCCCINFLNCRIVANINILLLHIDCSPSPVLFYLMLKVLKCKEKLTEAYNESCSEIGDINSWAPHTECNASHLNLCRNLLSFIFSAIITVLGTPLIRRNEIFSFLLVC